jgi:uncharacterized membrane protein
LLVRLAPTPFTAEITIALGAVVVAIKAFGYDTVNCKSLVVKTFESLLALVAEVTIEPTGAVIT